MQLRPITLVNYRNQNVQNNYKQNFGMAIVHNEEAKIEQLLNLILKDWSPENASSLRAKLAEVKNARKYDRRSNLVIGPTSDGEGVKVALHISGNEIVHPGSKTIIDPLRVPRFIIEGLDNVSQFAETLESSPPGSFQGYYGGIADDLH